MSTQQTPELFTPKKVSHLFTQFFLHKQCVTENDLDRLIDAYKKRLPSESIDTVANKKELLNKSNKVLRTFGFQIKRVFDQFTNKYFYIFFNEIEDSASKQMVWSQHENTYFFLLIDEIIGAFLREEIAPMETESSTDFDYMLISSNVAINLARNASLKQSLAEQILDNWINLHWFEKNSAGRLTLGIRSLSEMSSYLIKKFCLSPCFSCHFVCLFGRKCPKCAICLHKHCSFSSKSQKGVFSCPLCSSKLTEPDRILPPPSESNLEEEEEEATTTQESEDTEEEEEEE